MFGIACLHQLNAHTHRNSIDFGVFSSSSASFPLPETNRMWSWSCICTSNMWTKRNEMRREATRATRTREKNDLKIKRKKNMFSFNETKTHWQRRSGHADPSIDLKWCAHFRFGALHFSALIQHSGTANVSLSSGATQFLSAIALQVTQTNRMVEKLNWKRKEEKKRNGIK